VVVDTYLNHILFFDVTGNCEGLTGEDNSIHLAKHYNVKDVTILATATLDPE